jgi:integrase
MRADMIKRVERASGTVHQVYGRRGGKKVYVGSYPSKAKAEEAEEDFRVQQRKIERGELPPAVDGRRTLSVAAEAWLAGLLKSGARCEQIYRGFMNQQILPWLGRLPLDKIGRQQIVSWRDDCATKYAGNSVNSAMSCLGSAFQSFVDLGWIAVNPCRGVKRVKLTERSYNWLRTVPEVERLLRSCDGDIRDIVATAVGTGMRIDEVLHLAWDDVDLERRLLTVQRGRKGPPKGGMRHIPILDGVLPVLQERSLKRGGAFLVFPSRTKRVRNKSHVTTSYKAALDRAELDHGLRFHDLRHTFASHWVMNGGDIFRLSKVLGHKSVAITQKIYAHLAPEAWTQDYHRVTFRLPSPATVIEFTRGDRGQFGGKRRVASGDAREIRFSGLRNVP